jgi:phage-related protein
MKPVSFVGTSLDDLRAFPVAARRAAGFQIDKLQRGLNPDSRKPMATIGSGVREIRVQEASGAFRVVYVATLPDAVHVLHAFQKKSRTTPKRDIELASRRLTELLRRQSP